MLALLPILEFKPLVMYCSTLGKRRERNSYNYDVGRKKLNKDFPGKKHSCTCMYVKHDG